MDIYCINCGTKNDSSSQFCESCGTPLARAPAQPVYTPPAPPPPKPRSWVSKVASIGAMVVVVFFFLPWVSVSCTAAQLGIPATSISGNQIATGHIPLVDNLSSLGGYLGDYGLGSLGLGDLGLGDMGLGTHSTSDLAAQLGGNMAYPAIWLILVIGLLGFASLVGGPRGGKIAIAVGALGIIALFIVGLKIGSINSQISMYGFKLKTELGLIFEWAGFIFLLVMGVLSQRYDIPGYAVNPLSSQDRP